MTPAERRRPKIIDAGRRRRIAAGSGTQHHEVNELIKQFDGMASVMKSMAGRGVADRMRMVRELQQGGLLDPGGRIARQKKGTGKRLSTQERVKLKKLREREIRRRKRRDTNSPAEQPDRRGFPDPEHHQTTSQTQENVTVAVRIRMKRLGRTHRPFYRICAMDAHSPATAE